jgi:uncharacterized SAM-binding protein YcdF (DUF218 family)
VSIGVALALAVAGVASAAYGLWFVLAETKMRFHYFWFTLAIVLVAPIVLMTTGLWEAIPFAVRAVVGVLLVLFLVYEVVFAVLVMRHFRDKAPAGLDYVAVLGAQVLEWGPGRTLANRLDVARVYLNGNPQCRCIACGAQGSNEPMTEAQAEADYLEARGIARDRILLEDRSYSTVENLRNAAAMIDAKHDVVGIVTSDFHVARSLAIARKAGFAHAFGMPASSNATALLSNIVRESFAWTKDILSGNA